jgi:hypothetical protein
MGQGDFYLEYPKLHEMAASKNWVRPHDADFSCKAQSRAVPAGFLKPSCARDAGVCSCCPKCIDVPEPLSLIHGFNEYDNWQPAEVGPDARSFYYPKACSSAPTATCHSRIE